MKIKRIDEKRVPLTNKEKLAFYGLVKYPDLTSKEIGNKIGLQEATVNSIKNRLKKEGYFKRIYIPRYDLMGCNLLSVKYMIGDMKAMDKNILTEKTKKEMFEKIMSTPEKFYFMPSDKEAFSIEASSSWQNFKEIDDSFEEEIHKRKIKLGLDETIHFPLEKSNFYDYFNFATIIKNKFELDIKDTKKIEPGYMKYNLSMNEKKLIYALIKYPELTVAKLSKKARLSVPTVCKLRKNLLRYGIIKVVNFPDFVKIGMELIVLNHYRDHQYLEDNKNKEDSNYSFFSIGNKKDIISIELYKDYVESREKIESYSPNKDMKLSENPAKIIIPLESIKFSKMDFLPLIKKTLELDIEL